MVHASTKTAIRSLFDPSETTPYKISRTKIDLFLQCPRCFYLDRRVGITRPPGFPFALNTCVDELLKREFDSFRKIGKPHPLMEKSGINAVPLQHENLEEWRDALRRGIQYLHQATNFIVTGGIDDVWVSPTGELIIVDYKATSKKTPVTLDADWQISYKRQMEVYQWLFLRNGFKVSPIGYFVYCNGNSSLGIFDARIEFDITLIPYKGDPSWIEETLEGIRKCLTSDVPPLPRQNCTYCDYFHRISCFERMR